ncbi:MAG TPA: hypothetical protein VF765_23765 [Polyangiaceae bacterium]
MATTNLAARILAVLLLPTKVLDLLKAAHAIVTAMTGNPRFPAPVPPLPTVTGLITTLAHAEQATATRAKGTVQARNAARRAVVQALGALKAYVQTIADAALPEDAATIITSAGMTPKKAAVRVKPPFAATAGALSGSVKLTVRSAGHRASYEWQSSIDGGKTWVDATPSLQAKTTITGLPVGSTVQVRFRAIIKGGPGNWSQPLGIVVK